MTPPPLELEEMATDDIDAAVTMMPCALPSPSGFTLHCHNNIGYRCEPLSVLHGSIACNVTALWMRVVSCVTLCGDLNLSYPESYAIFIACVLL